jgi:hypothetical protein
MRPETRLGDANARPSGPLPESNPIDLSPEVLSGLTAAYQHKHGRAEPPWINSRGGIDLGGALLQRLARSGIFNMTPLRITRQEE